MACQAHETDGYQGWVGIPCARPWSPAVGELVCGCCAFALQIPSPASQAADTTSPVYDRNTLALLGFVTQARRLGFRLDGIKRIVALKRSG
jgi:hypothetical protein